MPLSPASLKPMSVVLSGRKGFYFIWNFQKFAQNCSKDEGKRKYFQTEALSHLSLWLLQREIITQCRWASGKWGSPAWRHHFLGRYKAIPFQATLLCIISCVFFQCTTWGQISSYSWIIPIVGGAALQQFEWEVRISCQNCWPKWMKP